MPTWGPWQPRCCIECRRSLQDGRPTMETLLKIKVEQKFRLERATAADREALFATYESFDPKGEAFGLPPRKEPWQWLDSLACFPNLIVKVEGRVVGHGVLCVEGDKGETAIFVHQDWRRRGIGRLLLQGLIDEARRLGLRRVWGMADISNVAMLRLAESLGFFFSHEHGILHFEFTADPAEGSGTISAAA